MRRSTRDARLRMTLCLALLGLTVTGCGTTTTTGNSAGGGVDVVAAENFWGSIAAQVGGSHVHVTSIIVNPDTDPHDYEAKPVDARAIAVARYVIVNGAGYDPWAPKLLDANPVAGRQVLSVGDMLGKKEGDNPHFWYSPEYVDQVIDRVAADLKRLDPAHAAYFEEASGRYKTVGLKDYKDTIAAVRRKYGGVPVGATESIFVYLATPLGLNLITPSEYMKAISEGTDPSAADKAAIHDQIAGRTIRVLVFNSQNTTPEVNAQIDSARAQGIPVTSVTETLAPAGATFQEWQTAQLKALLRALGG